MQQVKVGMREMQLRNVNVTLYRLGTLRNSCGSHSGVAGDTKLTGYYAVHTG